MTGERSEPGANVVELLDSAMQAAWMRAGIAGVRRRHASAGEWRRVADDIKGLRRTASDLLADHAREGGEGDEQS